MRWIRRMEFYVVKTLEGVAPQLSDKLMIHFLEQLRQIPHLSVRVKSRTKARLVGVQRALNER